MAAAPKLPLQDSGAQHLPLPIEGDSADMSTPQRTGTGASRSVGAMGRTRSREERELRRRALPAVADKVAAKAVAVPNQGPRRRTLRGYSARGEPGPEEHHEIMINALRGELHAAMQLMEHREAWWMQGMRNAEVAVGTELGSIRNNEVIAAQHMHAEMSTLTDALRNTQEMAENRALATNEQRQLVQNLNVYLQRLNAQGRVMIANAEHQQWRTVLDLRVAREEIAHAKAEADRCRELLRGELQAQMTIVDRRANAVETQAKATTAELRSAKAEADEISRDRLQQGLEAQITIETLRGELIDRDNCAGAVVSTLRSELDEARVRFHSDAMLGEL